VRVVENIVFAVSVVVIWFTDSLITQLVWPPDFTKENQ
jgi:hypothetical protein